MLWDIKVHQASSLIVQNHTETTQNSSLRYLRYCPGLYFLAIFLLVFLGCLGFLKAEFSAKLHFAVARFYLKIKLPRGQEDGDNLMQTDNKLF